MIGIAFSPIGDTLAITSVVGSTLAAKLNGTGGNVIMAFNSGAAVAFLRLGGSDLADASAVDIPLPPNSMMPFSLDPNRQAYAKVFSGTGGMAVYLMRGGGA